MSRASFSLSLELLDFSGISCLSWFLSRPRSVRHHREAYHLLFKISPKLMIVNFKVFASRSWREESSQPYFIVMEVYLQQTTGCSGDIWSSLCARNSSNPYFCCVWVQQLALCSSLQQVNFDNKKSIFRQLSFPLFKIFCNAKVSLPALKH